MRHPHYIALTEPRKIRIANHPEAPAIEASVLKILRIDGPDELSSQGHVLVTFGYGFIDSAGTFVLLDSQIVSEFIVDIAADKEDGSGVNPMTRQREKAGDWFTRLTQPTSQQPNRMAGDFRQRDLYEHLIQKLGIEGTINVRSREDYRPEIQDVRSNSQSADRPQDPEEPE